FSGSHSVHSSSMNLSLRWQWLLEERTVALERCPARPVCVQLTHLEPARRDLVDDDLRCNSEAAPIRDEEQRWNVDYRKVATWPQRAEQTRDDRCWLGQVVVHAAHHDRIAAGRRQSGFVGCGFHNRDVVQTRVGYRLAKRVRPGRVSLAREDMPGWAD